LSTARAQSPEPSKPENRSRTGQFTPGTSGNPGGRPKSLARTTREAGGEDGNELFAFWKTVMLDESQPMKIRLDASRLIAERGWGKAINAEPEVVVIEAGFDNTNRKPTRERALELVRIAQDLDRDGLIPSTPPEEDSLS
jgi:hypothetical protein